jgi:MoaA/NifB/PqqE/SkfB family radical SAM enzyme
MIGRIAASGVPAVSVSLDGCRAQTHDGVRGIAGHFQMTVAAIAQVVDAGVTVQVNTTVMDGNVGDLPGVAALVARAGVHIWEVFFLVQVGRGTAAVPLSPAGHEDVPFPVRRVGVRLHRPDGREAVLPPRRQGAPRRHPAAGYRAVPQAAGGTA